ncbi:PH domain-containing protein [Mycolicibacterium frederiksbergense]|uniref:PH domain-containing protein n=1 Tax=Mycolicibacterium frederiksbergense TaxID=117567 RepID=A0A6H0SD78_9MYCO|nr:PH domain-containing protein [Mycolicibacterium frederiksbergense]QIV85328.1 PH domain-containing protein [Mycolicibacterium frederiksbergense]
MQQTSWAPKTAGIVWIGVIGLVMATVAVTVVTDLPGRVLGGVAALGLILFATASWRARPKLAITDAGLEIRGWLSTRVLTKADITLIRITEFRRLARKVRLLEIDTADDRLHVFTRWDLGTDPLQVLDTLTDAGYTP